MEEQGNQTINQEQGIPTTTQPSGPVSESTQEAPSTFRTSSDEDLISTVDLIPPQKPTAKKADTEPEGANKTKDQKEEAKKSEGDAALEERYDKIPRFKELLTESKKARQELEQLKAQLAAKKETSEETEELPYKDVSKMTKEEILEWQDSDPHGYHENLLKQAEFNLTKRMEEKMGARSFEDAIAKTYSDFAKKNPDFDDLWDTGELTSYMKVNPGHNAISAYYALTSEKKTQTAEKEWQEKMDKAVKAAEKRAQDAYRVKRESQVLPSGPGWTGLPEGVSPELLDSKKFGGSTAVLAARSAARMAAKGQR